MVQRARICWAQTQKQPQLQLPSRRVCKKKFLKNCCSEKFHEFLLTVDCFFFYYILCVHISRWTLMEIKTVLDLFYVISTILDLEIFFSFLLFFKVRLPILLVWSCDYRKLEQLGCMFSASWNMYSFCQWEPAAVLALSLVFKMT